MAWLSALAFIVLAIMAGYGVPALAMRLLYPSLVTTAPRVRNYRGKHVMLGLGIVWVMWSVSVGAAYLFSDLVGQRIAVGALGPEGLRATYGSTELFAAMPVALVLGAFAFGLIDDVFGDPSAKGFRGHLGAVFMGRLTTGALKLFGIGALAALATWGTGPFASTQIRTVTDAPHGRLVVWLLATAVIALAANLVNLTDLRPGRALKSYSVLVMPVFAVIVLASIVERGPVLDALQAIAVLAALLFGPVLAVWRYDLSERAMLGDAGANAFGVLAGYMLALTLPKHGFLAAFVILLALNLLSEKVSFSALIEGNAVLRWFDGLGRRAEE